MTPKLSLKTSINEAIKQNTINALVREYDALEYSLIENVNHDRDVQLVRQLDEMGYFDVALQEKGNARRQREKNLKLRRDKQRQNVLAKPNKPLKQAAIARNAYGDSEDPDIGGFDDFDAGTINASDMANAGIEGLKSAGQMGTRSLKRLGQMFSSAVKGGMTTLAGRIKKFINKARNAEPDAPLTDVPGVTPQAAQADIPVRMGPRPPRTPEQQARRDAYLAQQDTSTSEPEVRTGERPPRTPEQQAKWDAHMARKATKSTTVPVPIDTTSVAPVEQPAPESPTAPTVSAEKPAPATPTTPPVPTSPSEKPATSTSSPKVWTEPWVDMRRKQLDKMNPAQRVDVKDRALKMTGHEPTRSVADRLKTAFKGFKAGVDEPTIDVDRSHRSMFREIAEIIEEQELSGLVTAEELLMLAEEDVRSALLSNRQSTAMLRLMEHFGVLKKTDGILTESTYSMDELIELLKEAGSFFKPWATRSSRGRKFGGRGVEKGSPVQIFPAPTKPAKEKAPSEPEPEMGTAANYRWHPSQPIDKVGLKRFKNPAAEEPKSISDFVDKAELADIMSKISDKKTRPAAIKRLKAALLAAKQAQSEPDPIKDRVSSLPLTTGASDLEMNRIISALNAAIQVQKAKEKMAKIDADKGTQSDTEGSGKWTLSPAGEREVAKHAKMIGADYQNPTLSAAGTEIEDVPLPHDGKRETPSTMPRGKTFDSMMKKLLDPTERPEQGDPELKRDRKVPAVGTKFAGDPNTQHSSEEEAQKDMKLRGQKLKAAQARAQSSVFKTEALQESLDITRLQFLAGIKPLDI